MFQSIDIRTSTSWGFHLPKVHHYTIFYQFAHHFEDKLTTMQTFPEELSGHAYYFPTEEGREGPFKKRLAQIKAWHREHDGKEE